MRGHLTQGEMLECIGVGADAPQREHLDGCSACAAAMAIVEKQFAATRGAIAGWTRSVETPESVFLAQMLACGQMLEYGERRQRTRMLQLAAAILLLMLVPAGMFEQRRERRAQDRADDILLRQVDAGIAEQVPTAIEPMTRLVLWPSVETDAAGSAGAGEATAETGKATTEGTR